LTKTVTDAATSTSRTWTYTYISFGNVLTAGDPRTDVVDKTTYTFYTCTTVQAVNDALNHIATYNAHGQPLTIADPNNVLITLTYDLRQRLSSRQAGTETTTFTCWPTGLLKKITLPDSSYMQYTYDAAHRLTSNTDSLGNHFDFTLDAMGNGAGESAYDPGSILHRTHTRVFNTLNLRIPAYAGPPLRKMPGQSV
jgi:YD repeat-containing protein